MLKLMYLGNVGSMGVNVHSTFPIETFTEHRDESDGRRARTIRIPKVDRNREPFDYYHVDNTGLCEIQITPKNMKSAQAMIMSNIFELYFEEQMPILYQFGDFKEEIIKETKQKALDSKSNNVTVKTNDILDMSEEAEAEAEAVSAPVKKRGRKRYTPEQKAERAIQLKSARMAKNRKKVIDAIIEEEVALGV
jgi:hypothetical protein